LLSDEGLEAALDELTRTTDVPTRLVWSGELTVPSDAGHAIYLAVASVLDAVTPHADGVTIIVGRSDEELDATLVLEGVAADVKVEIPAGVLDRIGALGGSATIETTSLVSVRIGLPCAW
jgi:5-enolpyruvylshikimate-3-phosphate synthase